LRGSTNRQEYVAIPFLRGGKKWRQDPVPSKQQPKWKGKTQSCVPAQKPVSIGPSKQEGWGFFHKKKKRKTKPGTQTRKKGPNEF